jgi:tetratricopeptide (TPR) repeat protein
MRTLRALSLVAAVVAALAGCARPKVAPEPPPPAPPASQSNDAADTLRQANTAAANGQIADANRLYASVVDAPNVSRDAVVNAATGLYRTGDYAGAVRAFAKLGTFARGEEDLRYYNAVSLYEMGRYAEAKHELACALPYISVTPDVDRYRTKIEAK